MRTCFWVVSVSLLLCCVSAPAFAKPALVIAKHQIVGSWVATKIIGNPCASFARSVQVTLSDDGTYRAQGVTNSPLGPLPQQAVGRYKLRDNTIQGIFGPQSVGPFSYVLTESTLLVRSANPECSFYFRRTSAKS